MMQLKGDGWSGHFYGECPVQGDGEIDGRPFYFRARWDSWELDIAEPGGEPLDVDDAAMARGEGWRHEEIWPGGPYDAGYMKLDDAQRCMDRAVALYRVSRPAPS